MLEPLRHCGNKDFVAVFFRRTFPEITNPGGLWDESMKLYPLLRAKPVRGDLYWKFPSGMRVEFAHLQHEETVQAWLGAQVPLLCFDQLELFSERQFFYLMSRNRSLCGVRPYVRATCNPDCDSWLAGFLAWWIDQDAGLPIPERAGKIRWFVRVNEILVWANRASELRERFPDSHPKSVTFIPAKLTDNKILMKGDPAYMGKLLALPLVERERLLGGNWKVRASAGKVFNRDWFEVVTPGMLPHAGVLCRFWDFACLIAGTMVETDRGHVPIESIMAGDRVLTRQGYRRVKWAGMTKVVNRVMSVKLSNGSVLAGTPDHRVWTENRGWVALKDLSRSDHVVYTNTGGNLCETRRGRHEKRTRKPLSLRGKSTPADLERSILSATAGIEKRSGCGLTLCTGRSGAPGTATSPRSMTSITLTEITTTTPSKTWSVSPSRSTLDCTTRWVSLTPAHEPLNTENESGSFSGQTPSTRSTAARSAAQSSSPDGSICRPSIALVCAMVERHISDGWIAVYDLEVEDCHEFFANGILVHNCTAKKLVPKTQRRDPDYTAGVSILYDPKGGRYYVTHMIAKQIGPADLDNLVLETTRADAAECQRRQRRYLVRWEIEPGSAGIRESHRLIKMLAGLDAKGVDPRGDKLLRAKPLACQAEASNVDLLKGAWNEAWLTHMHHQPDLPHDDICFVAGTLIETANGSVPIESVRAGEMALTSEGYQKVVNAGQTSRSAEVMEVLLSNGERLIGTPNHPVFVVEKVFSRLDSLLPGDILYGCPERTNLSASKHSFSTASPSEGIRILQSGITGCTSRRTPSGRRHASTCTEKSGSQFMGTFQMGTSSITWTATRSIMTLATWSASHHMGITSAFTMLKATTIRRPEERIWNEYVRWLLSGMQQKKEGSGTASTPRKLSRTGNQGSLPVETVALILSPDATSPACGSALHPVRTSGDVHPDSMMRIESVGSARSPSRRTKRIGTSFVRVRVLAVLRQQRVEPVYNLTVEGVPEYFASGVLVHNCDASAGAFQSLTALSGSGTPRIIGAGVSPSYQGNQYG